MSEVMEMWAAEAARMAFRPKRPKSDPRRGPARVRENRCAFCRTIVTAQNWRSHDQRCYGTDQKPQGAGGSAIDRQAKQP